MVVTTTLQFHLKSKVSLELNRWPQTQSPVQVSTNVVMEDLPVVSTRPSHSLCSQGVQIAAVMSVTDWWVSKLRSVQVNLHASQYWVNSEATK